MTTANREAITPYAMAARKQPAEAGGTHALVLS